MPEVIPLSGVKVVVIVGLLVTIGAGPLSSAATLTAVGQVSLFGLIGVGGNPLLAVVAVLASTEGASPSTSRSDSGKTFALRSTYSAFYHGQDASGRL